MTEHNGLHQKRVVKRVKKGHPGSHIFLREVKILKNLKHAAFPILYDYEEDEEFGYLIEEYVAGESYQNLMLCPARCSTDAILEDFRSLCQLLLYLHEQKPYPILYLDLKPEHVIRTPGGIRLLDFGAALELKERPLCGDCLGTRGFAAPEQLTGGNLDERTDIYSVGAWLFWCLTGRTIEQLSEQDRQNEKLFDVPKKFQDLVAPCLEENPMLRFQSFQEVIQKVDSLKKEKPKQKALQIAVVGSQPRIGVTHLSFFLTVYLNRENRKCLYEEKNESSFLQTVKENSRQLWEQDGLYCGKQFYGIPKYGQAVLIEKEEFAYVVQDYGVMRDLIRQNLQESDKIVAVLGSQPWEIQASLRLIEQLRMQQMVVYVLQPGDRTCQRRLQQACAAPCYYMPNETGLFSTKKTVRDFFRQLTTHFRTDSEKGGRYREAYGQIKERYSYHWNRRN